MIGKPPWELSLSLSLSVNLPAFIPYLTVSAVLVSLWVSVSPPVRLRLCISPLCFVIPPPGGHNADGAALITWRPETPTADVTAGACGGAG